MNIKNMEIYDILKFLISKCEKEFPNPHKSVGIALLKLAEDYWCGYGGSLEEEFEKILKIEKNA